MNKLLSKLALLITVLFLAIYSNSCFGQSFSFGAKGGISIPNLTSSGTSNPLNSGYSSGLGPDAALFGEYHVSNLFSVELDVEYSSQGGKKNGKQALPVPSWVASMFPPGQAPNYLYANFNASAEINYLLIPLMAKFNLDIGTSGHWGAYVAAGPFAGFLLSAKTITSGTSNVYADAQETQPLLSEPVSFDTTADIKDQLYNTNYGIVGNIGLVYQWDQHRVFLEAGGNYGLKTIQKDKANGENKTGAAVIRFGYAYTIGQKRPGAKSVKEPTRF